ncbi:PREDICTED: alpha-1,3-mannosyl-glycoprotein 4-beta-N-acetylglucosaminyltransferase-like protein MGAT4E isoform X2 [Miniopterus natalensis]|uniref:alpha-1,3-mannosyl-glycoprotein 4-beta-N-acetylglucosaminyltransferase-like protein MGAT4E isoform X2 n=1 Tax=Miniopterus natalensis TaxID=291302 RepID=UPI0007A6FA92|nr:PREDICTED: alpha-1,3-mannosyl-glycoprotein 4-beta-N-acetylglucosaminyltransferase-like protein MGAT4E isoform X2 [Miniopterus natalensis]
MPLWKYSIVAVFFISLSFFLQDKKKKHLEYSVSLEEKKKILQQLNQEQISSESKNHLETFKEMQRSSPVLQQANYKVLAGARPQEKKLLTMGISSVQRPHGSTLLHTLQSLFEASSVSELNCIVVLVHLSDPDPKWLSQMVTNISVLFQPHIEDQELLVIHGSLSGSPVPGDLGHTNDSAPCEAVYSRQKADYALLMNFATSLSEYFLMIEDDVYCTPKFVSTIYWALSAWKERPWVIMEFSSLSFSGKVLHTSDLPRLTAFLLLFPKDTPTHLLLSQFRLLLAQHVPIHFSPPVFYRVGSYSASEDSCFPVEKEMVFGEPDNPVASVLTDMRTVSNVIPQYAYVLNDECYSTMDPLRGNTLTVILEKPQKVIRIEVLTGSDTQGLYRLQQGQVELGYGPLPDAEGCARYTLLGPLVQGNLDQRVFYEEDTVEQLSCIRLVVLASQDSWLLIRQIRVWTQPEEEER